ncbi:MAG: hypothetical protein IPM48_05390 [Saprospiraceae bacterium]|nr:hypothetical protein [Saprospiraceae bacterium]
MEKNTLHNTSSTLCDDLVLKDIIQHFRFWGPFARIQDDYFAHVHLLLKDIPCSVSDYFGFEFHLTEGNFTPDLLICIHKPDQLIQWIQTFENRTLHEDKFVVNLQSLASLHRYWNHNLNGVIQNIWFEFDAKDLQTKLIPYSFFFGPSLSSNRLEILLACEKIFKMIMAENIQKDCLQKLLDCYSLLDGVGIISQIGFMKARNQAGLRLFIEKLNPSDIVSFLDKASHSIEQYKDLESILQLATNCNSIIALDVDITEKLSEKIGLEFYFKNVDKSKEFLTQCMINKLCDGILAQEFLKLNALHFLEQDNPYHIWFSHFKIVFHPMNGAKMKAYTGFKFKNDF